MENASKALLIAAAILIAIVLISLGVMVLGQGSQLVQNADMSSTEISAYNEEFKGFLGSNVRGTTVRQLIEKVNQHNRSNNGDLSKQIAIESTSTANSGGNTVDLDKAATTIGTSTISTGYSYTVTADYNSGGLISKIYVQKNAK